ncbi:MAG: hypothetical protein J7M14_03570, partial [Planctomycetes bacterium]|nr:hypothetical protein [Planctomycetota bacterium]
ARFQPSVLGSRQPQFQATAPPGSIVQAEKPPAPQIQVRAARSRRRRRPPQVETTKSGDYVLHSNPDHIPSPGMERIAADISRTRPSVDLSSRELLRNAIIYYEIFSPPKAMRHQREMWDI